MCLSKSLLVTLNSQEGLPIAHTRSATLELLAKYDMYADFSASVLNNHDGLSWKTDAL